MKHAALLSATEAAEMILRVGAGFSCIWCSIVYGAPLLTEAVCGCWVDFIAARLQAKWLLSVGALAAAGRGARRWLGTAVEAKRHGPACTILHARVHPVSFSLTTPHSVLPLNRWTTSFVRRRGSARACERRPPGEASGGGNGTCRLAPATAHPSSALQRAASASHPCIPLI